MKGRAKRRVPLMLQMEIVECGAACLGMVLASFGRWATFEELRERCKVTRNGSSAADLVTAAASYGMSARAFSGEVDRLKSLPLPQVLFWDFDHFVVLEGWSGERFHLADPAFGRRTMDRREFGRHFTGVTLTFERGADFVRSPRPAGIVGSLWAEAKRSMGALWFILAANLLLTLIAILIPSFTRIFIDDYLGRGFHDWLLPLLGALLATTVLRTALAWLNAAMLQTLTAKITIDLSASFIWRLFHLPLQFFVHRSAGEISTRAQLGGIAGAVAGPLVQAGMNLMNMAMFALAMALYSLPLAAMAVGFALATLLLLRLFERLLREGSVRLDLLGGSAHATAIQGMALMEDYKATGTEDLLFERLLQAELRHVDAEQSVGRVRALAQTVPRLAGGLLTVLVLGVGTLQLFQGRLTIGELVGFYMLAEMFAAALSTLFLLASSLQSTSGAVVRVADTLDHAIDPLYAARRDEAQASVGRLAGAVEARGLHYAYGEGAEVLRGVDLVLAPGERVAIVGPSGSGKSTLGRLLVGLVQPTAGELRFDGRPIGELPEALLRSSLGYVDQQPYLFSGRVRDNVTLWDATVETDQVQRALHDAAAAEAIAARPGGLDGRVGENGNGLSGGERQMLAIARALVHEPSFLVLDEATSALDALSEERVIESLRRRAATCVMITHRASAIRLCSRLIVMEGGRIVADGPPDAVLRAAGSFAGLVEAAL